MKTITKTFYVSDVDLKDISQNDHLDNCEDILLSTIQFLHYKNQIQISWQEPEKKIEITESEFNKAIECSRCNEIINLDTLRELIFGAEK